MFSCMLDASSAVAVYSYLQHFTEQFAVPCDCLKRVNAFILGVMLCGDVSLPKKLEGGAVPPTGNLCQTGTSQHTVKANDLRTKSLPGSRRFTMRIMCRVDRKGAGFIGYKQTHLLTNIQTLNCMY